MKKIILSISGMTCSACSNGLEKYLNKQDGVIEANVNLVMATATIEYDETMVSKEKLEEFVAKAGFKSLGIYKEEKTAVSKHTQAKAIVITSTVIAICFMYISMGHMLNLPVPKLLNPHVSPVGYTICLIAFTLYFLIYGLDILKNGYKNLVHKTPNMDTLVGIGVLSSLMYSLYAAYNIFCGNVEYINNLYFESAGIVIYFVKLGRYIDRINKDKTREAIQKLVDITPDRAVLKLEDGSHKVITIDEVKKGDILISRAGEKLAVDGTILSGKAHFDESFITGESQPVFKKQHAKVIAGSLNYDGYVEYMAERIGKDSTVSEIVRLVSNASSTKAPLAKIADKISGYFIPTVILIAIVVFLVYILFGQSFGVSLNVFVTILVVACPCSLGLATPLAAVVGIGLCANHGILIKKSETLENAHKIDTVVLDKTGTITYGKPKIDKVINYTELEEEKLLRLVASIEEKSTHPIAKAFKGYLKENSYAPYDVKEFEDIAGLGVRAYVEDMDIMLGNSKLIQKYNIVNEHLDDEKNLAQSGSSIVYVVKNSVVIAIIGVKDVVRKESKSVIEDLKALNISVIMLTGDNEKVAKAVADEVGITNVISNVTPIKKAEFIQSLKKDNKFVMMCGDGINDSPSLAYADVSCTLSSATDIAVNASDVLYVSNDLTSLLKLIQISKSAVRVIKQNLFWAFLYNLLMIPIAAGVLKPIGIQITPMLASLAMVLSSITVVLNTLRLKTVKLS